MKIKIAAFNALFLLGFIFNAVAQWPGNFYTFFLEDSSGYAIDTGNNAYKMSTIQMDSFTVLGIDLCKDNKLWRFYEGGNHYMGSIQKLKIEKTVKGKSPEVMIIVFPPSISGGKDQYYRNLYVGTLKFRNGIYKIKLPGTDDQWDKLKEVKLCPNEYDHNGYFDVSEYQ
jgi:hypothetical protein